MKMKEELVRNNPNFETNRLFGDNENESQQLYDGYPCIFETPYIYDKACIYNDAIQETPYIHDKAYIYNDAFI